MEIPVKESAAKADLALKLRHVFPEGGEVRMSRPVKRSEIRIGGPDASIQIDEIKEAVAAAGGCTQEDVKIGEIRKRSPSGMGAVWVQCPPRRQKSLRIRGE